ncbi:hypothetical protein REPUB_Repub10bG0063600 [Reevesia pubescens]
MREIVTPNFFMLLPLDAIEIIELFNCWIMMGGCILDKMRLIALLPNILNVFFDQNRKGIYIRYLMLFQPVSLLK